MKITRCDNGFLVHVSGLNGNFTVLSWSTAMEIAWKLGGGTV